MKISTDEEFQREIKEIQMRIFTMMLEKKHKYGRNINKDRQGIKDDDEDETRFDIQALYHALLQMNELIEQWFLIASESVSKDEGKRVGWTKEEFKKARANAKAVVAKHTKEFREKSQDYKDASLWDLWK